VHAQHALGIFKRQLARLQQQHADARVRYVGSVRHP